LRRARHHGPSVCCLWGARARDWVADHCGPGQAAGVKSATQVRVGADGVSKGAPHQVRSCGRAGSGQVVRSRRPHWARTSSSSRISHRGAAGDRDAFAVEASRSCVLWVPESRRTRRDLLILVDDAAASVTAPDLGGWVRQTRGVDVQEQPAQSSVRAMIVVVARELAEHGRGLSLIDDQDVVEQLARTAPRRRSAIALARRGCRGAGTRCRRGRNRWRGSRGPARTGTVARSGRTVEARDRGAGEFVCVDDLAGPAYAGAGHEGLCG
jgi:hypothetical protein